MEFKNNKEGFLDKIKEVLSHVSIKTYLYGILTTVVLIFIIIQTKSNDKNYLLNTNNGNTPCKDIYGDAVKIDEKNNEGCIDIYGAAKDFGIDLTGSQNGNTGNQVDYINNPNNNFTYDLSQDLVLTSLYLQQNGVTDDATRGKVLADVLSTYKNQVTGNLQTINSLNITRAENYDSYQNYLNDIVKAFDKYNTDSANHEKKYRNFDAAKLTVNSDGTLPEGVLNQLNGIINMNTDFINSLISIPATNIGASYQLQIINLLENQNAYLKSIIYLQTDPMKYLVLGGDDYLNNFQKNYTKIIDDFINYFNGLGITNQ